jgi:hypothetical protein
MMKLFVRGCVSSFPSHFGGMVLVGFAARINQTYLFE